MTTHRSAPMHPMTTLLVLVIVLSFAFAAVSIAYAAGRHEHLSGSVAHTSRR